MKELLETDQKTELTTFNDSFDKRFYEMTANFQEMETNLNNHHKQELEDFIQTFNKSYPELPKPSSDLINLNKQLEMLVKKKE